MKKLLFALMVAFGAISCTDKTPNVEVTPFGELSTGEATNLYTITNSNGAILSITDYGCRIVSIIMPDRDGNKDDVVTGPGAIEDFEKSPERFFGCVIGRYGNRIDHSSFSIDGVKYDVVANETFEGAPVQCHGGIMGFDRFVWDAVPVVESDRAGVKFHRLSPDGEEGFPGNLDCTVTYWLTNDNVVKLEYEATTDKATVVNLSNHTYFNLRGSDNQYVMELVLQVEADECVQNNTHFCPDIVMPVDDTPFDFREPHRVDYRLDMTSRHLQIMHGMSACWVVRDWDGTLRKVADLYDRRSGRGVETWTMEPAFLTYTGRGFDATKFNGKYAPIEKYTGMLLETIHFADSPNQDRFPSTILRPGERYYTTTEYHFYSR